MLYKPEKDQILSVEIKQKGGKIIIDFSADCGKFGSDEMLCGFVLTPTRLLQILTEREDITDDEV